MQRIFICINLYMHRFFSQCTISCRSVSSLLCFDGPSVALQKPEIFVVVSKSQRLKMGSYLSPLHPYLKPSDQVRNLGIILDCDLNF